MWICLSFGAWLVIFSLDRQFVGHKSRVRVLDFQLEIPRETPLCCAYWSWNSGNCKFTETDLIIHLEGNSLIHLKRNKHIHKMFMVLEYQTNVKFWRSWEKNQAQHVLYFLIILMRSDMDELLEPGNLQFLKIYKTTSLNSQIL